MKVNPEIGGKEDDDAVAAHIRELLLDAARIHLRSDVAVGTCLSGGIDSSTLTVLINTLIRSEAPESVGARQKTFSVVFSDKKFDESRYIDEVVAVTGVDADRTEPAPDQLWEDIDRLVYLQDEPFGSLSIYAQVPALCGLPQRRSKWCWTDRERMNSSLVTWATRGVISKGSSVRFTGGRRSARSSAASGSTGISSMPPGSNCVSAKREEVS